MMQHVTTNADSSALASGVDTLTDQSSTRFSRNLTLDNIEKTESEQNFSQEKVIHSSPKNVTGPLSGNIDHEVASKFSAGSVRRLTLTDAMNQMLAHSRPVESAYLHRQVDKINLEVAKREFVPKWTLTMGSAHQSAFNRSTDTRDASLGSRVATGATMKLPTGGSFNLNWGGNKSQGTGTAPDDVGINSELGFSQPLLKGAGLDVGTAGQVMAQRAEVASLLGLKSTLTSAVDTLIKAYRALVLSEKQLEINRTSLQRAKDLLRINQALVAAGRMPVMDLVQVEGELANRELSQSTEENQLDKSRIALLQLLGLDIGTRIVTEADYSMREVSPDHSQVVQTAFAKRPDYLQAKIAVENAKTSLMLAKNGMLWDLSLNARIGIAGHGPAERSAYGNSTIYPENNNSVDMSLSIPLEQLPLRQAKVQALVGLRQAELSLEQLRENIPLQLQDKIREVKVLRVQVDLAKKAKSLAERKLKIEEDRLKSGRSTNFQYLTFQDQLVTAQFNEIQTLISYQNAVDDLESMQGTTLEAWGISLERDISLPSY
ncbi:MAG: TolC family protein [Magnetococcus sp. DMHC-1]